MLDLLHSVQQVYNQTHQVIPLLMVAALCCVAVTVVLSAAQFYVERHCARGSVRALPPAHHLARRDSTAVWPRFVSWTGRPHLTPARRSTVTGEPAHGVAFPTFPIELLGKC